MKTESGLVAVNRLLAAAKRCVHMHKMQVAQCGPSYTLLEQGQISLIRLIAKDQNTPSGWASVSPVIRPLILGLPQELVEVLDMPGGWLNAKLSPEGEELFHALKWI